eukprot:jgi/Mesen1/9990/ME000072S09410
MFKRFIGKAPPIELQVPSGDLKASELEPRLTVHHGVPAASSILAYDAVQRLLAVGTRYVGDEQGLLSVIQVGHGQLQRLPYCVPAHITLGGVVRADSETSHSLVAILPHPLTSSAHRVLLVYASGLLVLWDLQALQVHAICGGTASQRMRLASAGSGDLSGSNKRSSVDLSEGDNKPKGMEEGDEEGEREELEEEEEEEEEEKDVCSACWASSQGTLAAIGYTDGDVYLWRLPDASPVTRSSSFKRSSSGSGARDEQQLITGVPARKVRLASAPQRVPVTLLRWCSGSSHQQSSGRLYIFGGCPIGQPEVISVVSLSDSEAALGSVSRLPWFGPVGDVLLLPDASDGSRSAAVVVLTVPGQLHVYDEKSVADCLLLLPSEGHTHPQLQPVLFDTALSESMVTATQLLVAPPDTPAMDLLLAQLPMKLGATGRFPSVLQSGRKWPISGGIAGPSLQGNSSKSVYLSGHSNGVVQVWDMSLPTLALVATATLDSPQEGEEAEVQHGVELLDMCALSGLLAVAYEHGLVRLYALSAVSRTLCRHTITPDQSVTTEVVECRPGFQCIGVVRLHEARVSALVLASGAARLAIADSSGLVTLVDLATFSCLFHGHCLPGTPTRVVAVAFASLPFSNGAPSPSLPAAAPGATSSPSSSSSAKKLSSVSPPQSYETVLYVAASTGALTIVDGTSGIRVGATPAAPKQAIAPISLHLLDFYGAPVRSLSGYVATAWAEYSAPAAPRLDPEGDNSTRENPLPAAPTSAGTLAGMSGHEAEEVEEEEEERRGREQGGDSVAAAPGSDVETAVAAPPMSAGEEEKEQEQEREQEQEVHGSTPAESEEAGSASLTRSSGHAEVQSARVTVWPEAHLVLLVAADYLYLFTTPSILQTEATPLKKIAVLEGQCCWSATFGLQQACLPFGVALLSSSGTLDIRSLPDLSQVEGPVSVNNILGWRHKAPASSLRRSACAFDGRLVLLVGDTELVRLSLFQAENALGLPATLPSLHDRTVAEAARAALVPEELQQQSHAGQQTSEIMPPVPAPLSPTTSSAAAGPAPLTHRSSLGGKLLGGMSKAITSASTAVTASAKTAVGSIAKRSLQQSSSSPSSSSKSLPPNLSLAQLFDTSPFSRSVPGRRQDSADLDDEGDDNDSTLGDGKPEIILPPLPSLPDAQCEPKIPDKKSSTLSSFFRKSGDARSMLLSTPSQNAVTGSSMPSPKQRTAEEIKAAYGYSSKKTASDAASAAMQARDKLMERGEKLQEIGRATEELQGGAEDFAAMAEALAKKYESKKWWEL